MTEEQYSMIIGKLTAMELMIISIAKTSGKRSDLLSEICEQREVLENALLHSGHSDSHVAATLATLDKLVDEI
jgi:hypothetical protein